MRAMPRRLRVFVSSTMKDLRNERAEVVRRLQQFNFEPVNAEGWLPDGSDAWSRIEDEIESCDIFVLLLGDTYGWTPTEGPKSDESLSVTELEYNHAAGKGLPILPFFKRLGDDADRTSGDATKRDKFRESVAKWSGGRVRAHFDLASDLADSVGNAIVELISNSYLRQAIVQRAPGVARGVARTASPRPTPVRRDPPPPELIDAVKAKRIALFAGAGISMSAGFPSGSAFVERLQHDLSQADPTYSAISPASRFAGVASDFELYFGREKLVLAVAQLMELPQGTAPTPAHRLAVQLFDKIVTTNYDDLF